jgi:hypothetical protein
LTELGRSFARSPRAFIRAAFTLTMLVLAGITLSWRSAEARLSEVMLGFGDELVHWQGGRAQSTPRSLSINGLELKVVTLTTQLSVRETLDHFDSLCRRRGGVKLPASAALIPATTLGGVFRQDTERQGVLACLDTERPLELGELSARLARLGTQDDLKVLGELRYFLARRSGDRTTLLALWTEGAAPLRSLFPKTGDAPGRDPQGLPRFPGARRLLSAREHGQPYGLTLHETPKRAADVNAWYEQALRAAGWTIDSNGGSLTARRGDRTVLVRVRASSAGRTVVSLAELG